MNQSERFKKSIKIAQKVILVTLFCLSLCFSDLYSQKYSYSYDDVTVSVSVRAIAQKSDFSELELDISFVNLSKNNIYIMYQYIRDSFTDTIYNEFHTIELGGNWEHRYGYEQIINLYKIASGDTLSNKLKCSVANNLTQDIRIFDKINGYYTNKNRLLLAFNFGYFTNSNSFLEKSRINTNDKQIEITVDMSLGLNIMRNLKKVEIFVPLILNKY